MKNDLTHSDELFLQFNTTRMFLAEEEEEEEARIVVSLLDVTERKRAEEELRESEERYRSLVDSTEDSIYLIDRGLNYLYANAKTLSRLRCPLYKLVGKGYINFHSTQATNKFSERVEQVFVSGKSLTYEYRSERDHRYFLRTLSPVIKPETKEIFAITIISKDITERKRSEEMLRESELRFRSVWEKSTDGMRITNEEGIVALANDAYCKMVEKPREEIEGKPMSIVYEEVKQTEILQKHQERFRSRSIPAHLERELVLWNGKRIFLELSNTFLENPHQPTLSLSVFKNITERKSAEEEILMLANALRSVNECVSITDLEDKLLFVNESFIKTYGYSEEELIGKDMHFVRSPNNPPELVGEILPATLRGGWTGELWNKRKDGSEFPIYLSTTVINDKNGKPLGLIGVAKDITERRCAEQEIISQKNRFAQLFENSPIAIALLDNQDKVVVINESFSALFGYFPEEIKGQLLNDLIVPPELKEEAKSYSDQTREGNQINKESYRKKKDGTLVYVQIVGVPVTVNDKTVGIYGMYVDLTQRKEAEEKMKIAKELAEQSDRLKTEFLAQMSHEIRTPINVITGNVDYLNQSFGEKMDTDARDCFDGIDLASKRIIRTIDLILNVADLQTSGYKPLFKKVDLNSEVLNRLFKEHQLAAKHKGLELIYKCELKETKILADEYSVTQIFANLLDNAIKYTKKGKAEILLDKNSSGNIIVEIKDTGIGMSKEFLSRMFEPFVQEDRGYTRSYEGNGLGLALVKRYCDINNAIIEVESEKNVGSTFRVIFSRE